MPHGPFFEPHPEFGGGGFGGGFGGPALALTAMTVFWLAALTWLLWPWIQSRLRGAGQPAESAGPVEAAQPTAVELLRQRYVLGQIDAFSFEEMLDHLLVSQAREHDFTVREASMRGAGWDRHGMPRMEPHMEPNGRDERVTHDGVGKALDSLDPHTGYRR